MAVTPSTLIANNTTPTSIDDLWDQQAIFYPDWSQGISVRREWKTVISASRNDTETRYSLVDKPLTSISSSVFGFEDDEALYVKNQLYRFGRSRALMPFYTDYWNIHHIEDPINDVYALGKQQLSGTRHTGNSGRIILSGMENFTTLDRTPTTIEGGAYTLVNKDDPDEYDTISGIGNIGQTYTTMPSVISKEGAYAADSQSRADQYRLRSRRFGEIGTDSSGNGIEASISAGDIIVCTSSIYDGNSGDSGTPADDYRSIEKVELQDSTLLRVANPVGETFAEVGIPVATFTEIATQTFIHQASKGAAGKCRAWQTLHALRVTQAMIDSSRWNGNLWVAVTAENPSASPGSDPDAMNLSFAIFKDVHDWTAWDPNLGGTDVPYIQRAQSTCATGGLLGCTAVQTFTPNMSSVLAVCGVSGTGLDQDFQIYTPTTTYSEEQSTHNNIGEYTGIGGKEYPVATTGVLSIGGQCTQQSGIPTPNVGLGAQTLLLLPKEDSDSRNKHRIYPAIESDVMLAPSTAALGSKVFNASFDISEVRNKATLDPLADTTTPPTGSGTYTADLGNGSQTHAIFQYGRPDPGTASMGFVSNVRTSRIGIAKVYDRYSDKPKASFTIPLVRTSRIDAMYLCKFFDHCRGKMKAFWCATPTSEIELVSVDSTTQITVKYKGGDVNDWDDNPHISMRCSGASGSTQDVHYLNKITGHSVSGDNHVLTLGTALNSNVNSTSKVSAISSAYLVRFSNDTMTENWQNQNLMSTTLEVVQVANEKDIDIELHDPSTTTEYDCWEQNDCLDFCGEGIHSPDANCCQQVSGDIASPCRCGTTTTTGCCCCTSEITVSKTCVHRPLSGNCTEPQVCGVLSAAFQYYDCTDDYVEWRHVQNCSLGPLVSWVRLYFNRLEDSCCDHVPGGNRWEYYLEETASCEGLAYDTFWSCCNPDNNLTNCWESEAECQNSLACETGCGYSPCLCDGVGSAGGHPSLPSTCCDEGDGWYMGDAEGSGLGERYGCCCKCSCRIYKENQCYKWHNDYYPGNCQTTCLPYLTIESNCTDGGCLCECLPG